MQLEESNQQMDDLRYHEHTQLYLKNHYGLNLLLRQNYDLLKVASLDILHRWSSIEAITSVDTSNGGGFSFTGCSFIPRFDFSCMETSSLCSNVKSGTAPSMISVEDGGGRGFASQTPAKGNLQQKSFPSKASTTNSLV
uniref:Uncharacterized protein n=1 Tax=Nelumbo nucifera TaxID=4432 RepID=A0A822XN94_NELNU|nr:TPA_asm: hypothetical protein HUJ06_022636 [Nelumbo nucifera]